MLDGLIPLLVATVAILALHRKADVYSTLLAGGRQGLQLLGTIVPTLVMLLSAVAMLRASGALDAFAAWAGPLFSFFGIPPETAPLVLLRPISGGGALAIGADLMATYGVDSPIGRTTAIMLGSTETTFYTISVYLGANGITKTRYAVPAALVADATGFVIASLSAKFL